MQHKGPANVRFIVAIYSMYLGLEGVPICEFSGK